MSAARRRMRRQARLAAKRLLEAGVSPESIGRANESDELKAFYMKVVRAAAQRVETGEGNVTVREGIAAAAKVQELERRQAEMADVMGEPDASVDDKAEEQWQADTASRHGSETTTATGGGTRAVAGGGGAVATPDAALTA